MYRDVHFKNILVTFLNSSQIVLDDYDKTIYFLSKIDSSIESISTLASKVNTKRRRNYIIKIDIWDIEYVCDQILFNSFMIKNLDMKKRSNIVWHQVIMTQLFIYAKFESLKRNFVDIVRKMLAWELSNKSIVVEALQHSCMQEFDEASMTSSSSFESQIKVSYINKASRLNKFDDYSYECHIENIEMTSFGARRAARSSSFDIEEAIDATWQTFHEQQARARAQISETLRSSTSKKELLRRR